MEAALKVLNEIEREGVITRYAIGGAVGAIFYMEPFLTYDLDVFARCRRPPAACSPLLRSTKR